LPPCSLEASSYFQNLKDWRFDTILKAKAKKEGGDGEEYEYYPMAKG
jgi:hypothetical protein